MSLNTIAAVFGLASILVGITGIIIAWGRWIGKIETKLDLALNRCKDQPCPAMAKAVTEITVKLQAIIDTEDYLKRRVGAKEHSN